MQPSEFTRRATLIALASPLFAPRARADDTLRLQALTQAASLLRDRYLDAALGARLAEGLQATAPSLAREADPRAFAVAVTQRLQSIVPDQHLRLSYEPEVTERRRIDPRDPATIARTNHGYDLAQRLDGNVGLLRINRFVPLAFSRATAQAAFDFIARADALLLDVRGNIGGAPDAVAFACSHLFPAEAGPVLLHAAENRAAATRNEVRTDPAAAIPALGNVPVCVVTDERTASAAELLADALRRTGRARIVGRRTSGAGNGGRKYDLPGGHALFLPEWKTLTGPGWEGTGVAPDVDVAASQALTAAHRLALQALLAQSAPPAVQAERRAALDALGAAA